MTIFFYKGLIRNSEIGNIPVWAFPNFWRLGQVMNTKFGSNLSFLDCYWMLQNSKVTVFTVFDLLRENQLPPSRLGFRICLPNVYFPEEFFLRTSIANFLYYYCWEISGVLSFEKTATTPAVLVSFNTPGKVQHRCLSVFGTVPLKQRYISIT